MLHKRIFGLGSTHNLCGYEGFLGSHNLLFCSALGVYCGMFPFKNVPRINHLVCSLFVLFILDMLPSAGKWQRVAYESFGSG